MTIEHWIDAITPEAYNRLLFAVETGRWPEGTRLSQQQRDSCMQVVMLYQAKCNTDAQHMSVAAGGELCLKSKPELKQQFSQQSDDSVRVKVHAE